MRDLSSFPDVAMQKYCGIPYALGLSARFGCDCWGLVELVYREALGVDLSHISEGTPFKIAAQAKAVAKGRSALIDESGFFEVEGEFQDMDILEMSPRRTTNFVKHVGIWWRGRVLHSTPETGSQLAELREAAHGKVRAYRAD